MAAPFLRSFTKRLVILANILAVVLFLLAALAAYCNPVRYWYIAILGVGFIFFTFILLGFIIVWLVFRSKWVFLPIAALFIGWYQIHALFAFNLTKAFQFERTPRHYRILTWNVSRWDEMNKQAKGGQSYRAKMFDYIVTQDADILCFQEFFESKRPDLFDQNIPYITRKLNYPYYYFSKDHAVPNGAYEHGVAIFSRYPITDTLRMKFGGPESARGNESLIRATIDLDGKRINVFTTHLQSFLFTGNDYRRLKIIKRADDRDSVMEAGRGIIEKFRKSYELRSVQADMVRKQLDTSRFPEIICGDFNDVPNSYTYFTIKGARKDAFVEKSFGLGRTFFFISPTLRIDYILGNSKFEFTQYKKTKLPYSDHFPVVSDFRFAE